MDKFVFTLNKVLSNGSSVGSCICVRLIRVGDGTGITPLTLDDQIRALCTM